LILQPSITLKITAKCLEKVQKKIKIITDLYDLYKEIPVGLTGIPQWVIDTYTSKEHKIFGYVE
jgi:lysozyme family protein